MSLTPTAEQEAIKRAYRARLNLVVNAYAGSGKTTMLRQLAEADPAVRFLYIAYGKTAKLDAAATFPRNARCYTSHGLAFRPMIDMASRVGKTSKYMPGARLAQFMGIRGPQRLTQDRVLAPGQFASVVKATILRFCYSADETVTRWHVPNDLKRFTEDEVAALRHLVPRVAQRIWDNDITQPAGRVPVEHDYYLKAYALTHPRLPGDVIALDEAQDSNPCVAAMIREQVAYGTRVIMVGDTYQQLFGWRMATDAMAVFAETPGVTVLPLTQSFRFGEEIAAEANKWLALLGAPHPLRGYGKIRSRVGQTSGVSPDAILCRTNAEAFRQAIDCLSRGLKVAFPKGAGELTGLVKAARDIKNGVPCEHPDLMAFSTWEQVQNFVQEEPDGADLQLFVKLVDDHGVDELFALLQQIGSEEKGFKGDVTISTAHSAKGREWGQVKVADDFLEPKGGPAGQLPEIPREMAMLAYVTVTRGQWVLDRGNEPSGGLSWVDKFLDGAPQAATRELAAV